MTVILTPDRADVKGGPGATDPTWPAGDISPHPVRKWIRAGGVVFETMQIKKLLQEDDAVSPVIGVILMVAITVILAAVIASFVLGLGGSQTQTPTASFSWDYNEDADDDGGDNDGVVTVSHDSGATIPYTELYIRGSGFSSSTDATTTPDLTDSGNWPKAQTSGNQGGESAVVSGDTVTVGVNADFELSVVWEPEEGDTSATLSEESGPNV